MNKKIDKEKFLVDEIKKDKRNFERIYELYYNKLKNYLRKRLREKSLCEDMASAVFEKAYKSIDDFKWQGVSLSAWIFRIARNLLTDHYRKIGRIGETVSLTEIENFFEDDEKSAYSEYIRDEEESALYDAIREFNEEDQYLIYYKFFEDITNIEIGKLVGITESNVGTKLYRIRKKLKKILSKKGIFK